MLIGAGADELSRVLGLHVLEVRLACRDRQGERESEGADSDFRARIAPEPKADAPELPLAIKLQISFPDEEVEQLATKDLVDLPGFRAMFRAGLTLHVPETVLEKYFEKHPNGPFEQRHDGAGPVKYALKRTFVANCVESGIGSILYVPSGGGERRWEKAYLDWSKLIKPGTP